MSKQNKTTTMKKALKIDVGNQEITEITVDHYTDIYKHIGNECNMFECPIMLPNGDTLYCDEEGLYHPIVGGLVFKKTPDLWIVGNCVFMGCDLATGDSKDVETTVEQLKRMIIWISKDGAELYATVH